MFYPIWLHPEEACHKWGELPHLPACSPPNPRTPVRGEWTELHSGWPVLHLKVDFRGDCKGTGKADRAGHYFLCYICIPWREMTRLSRQQKCFNWWFCVTYKCHSRITLLLSDSGHSAPCFLPAVYRNKQMKDYVWLFKTQVVKLIKNLRWNHYNTWPQML